MNGVGDGVKADRVGLSIPPAASARERNWSIWCWSAAARPGESPPE